MKRVVCWFSCGAASAVATKLAIAQYAATHEVVVARCVVREEHPDNDRFAADCEKWFGVPVVNLIAEKYNGSLFEVFRQERYMSGIAGARCTLELKKRVRELFQRPTDRHVFGYTFEEQDRFDNFLDGNNIDCVAPLLERGISHPDTLSMVQTAGIELPVMYRQGYEHNNCIGCVKAQGAGYWNKIRKDYPERFAEMAAASRALKVKLVKINKVRVSLDDLPLGIGRYEDEPKIQCGIFCDMANDEIGESA